MANNDRIGGWRLMHELIQANQWFIAENCVEALKAIPSLIHDEKKLEDVLKTDKVSDDVADELRYGLMSYLRPRGVPKEVQLFDHLAAATSNTARHMMHLQFEADWKKKHLPIKPRSLRRQ